ncbi:MAG TPA: SMC family ATPase [Candidatus Thermoplasmatota archaeon]|nr:SMC family ATPase [Candidatus Thermoplasmatota archaeon]
MLIRRVRIENYRRFREVDVEIPDGVTALVGRNGAGKSTLLEAIAWCLYGMDASRTEKDLIKRRGAAPADDVRVHVAFHLGPHAYEVTRELLGKAGSHVATVLVDGKLAVPPGPQSAKESVAYLGRALHMDARGFFTSLVARQRELAALTEARPAERRRILIGLLRLDAVDDAIQEARTRRRDARARLDALHATRQDPAAVQAAHDAALAAVEAARARLAATEARVAELVEEVEEVRARRDASRKVAEEHRAATQAILLVRERLALVGKERDRRAAELQRARDAGRDAALLAPGLALLPDAKLRCERLSELRLKADEARRVAQEAAQAETEAQRARADAAAAHAALANAPAARAHLEDVLAQRGAVDAALAAARQQAADARARAGELERLAQQAAQRLTALRKLGPQTPCPTCTRPLGEHHDPLVHAMLGETEQHRAALAATRAALDEATRAEAKLQHEHKALELKADLARRQVAALDRHEALLSAHAKRAEEAEARLQRLRDRHALLAAEPFDEAAFGEARRVLAELERDRDRHAALAAAAAREPELLALVTDLEAQARAAREQEAAAVRARDALGFDAAAHDALERAAAAREGALSEARVQRERAAGEQARRQDDARRLAEELERQRALARQAAELEVEARLLERLCGDDGLLLQFKDHLIGRIRPMLSAHAGRLFRDLTDGRYADLEVDDDYDLRVHDDGQAFALARFSGGEADLANLCLRLAVSQVVAERAGAEGFNFLALDEVFGSQDEGRKGNILRALKALGGRFRQIVLITHVDDVKEAAEHVIRVETLDDGTSRVTVEA